MSGIDWAPIGYAVANGSFSGTFDGCNHTISNLRSVAPDGVEANYRRGFFGVILGPGYANPVIIKNVTF